MHDGEFDGINDAQLMAHNDGESPPELARRISESLELAERAARIARLDDHLRDTLYRFNCPDTLLLNEFAAGILSESRAIAAHLRICPYCTAEVAQARQFLAESSADVSHDLLTRTRILIARLLPDIWANPMSASPALAGIRGSEGGTLTYEVEDYQVSLEVQEDPDSPSRRQLVGLVLGPAISYWQVHLWLDDRHVASVVSDETGGFVIPSLEPNRYLLSLAGEGVAVQIPDLIV